MLAFLIVGKPCEASNLYVGAVSSYLTCLDGIPVNKPSPESERERIYLRAPSVANVYGLLLPCSTELNVDMDIKTSLGRWHLLDCWTEQPGRSARIDEALDGLKDRQSFGFRWVG